MARHPHRGSGDDPLTTDRCHRHFVSLVIADVCDDAGHGKKTDSSGVGACERLPGAMTID
jgi:hypothetical protein